MKPEHDAIIKALTDPDPEVRYDAQEDVYVEMDEDLARALIDIVMGNASDDFRADAIVAFGPVIEECGTDYDDDLEFELDPELGPPVSREIFQEIVQRLRSIYDDERAPKLLRRRAFEVLVRDPKPWQRDEIRRHFKGDDEEWRLTAIFGMGAMTGFEKDLLDAVKNSKGDQLIEAVRAAGEMGLTEAATTIRDLAVAKKTDRIVRLRAIQALPNVDEDSFEILEDLARSKERDVAEVAKDALEELMMNQSIDENFDDDFDEE